MRALVVDLNNFSRYPTLSVGYIVSTLRGQGIDIDVLSPFAKGVVGYPRTVRASYWQLYFNFLKHYSAVSNSKLLRTFRKWLRRRSQPGGDNDKKVILEYFRGFMDNRPDVVLISTYTMYEDICREIGEECAALGVPVIVGGGYFVEEEITRRWSSLPGISAIYVGEVEFDLNDLVVDIVAGEDISGYPGVFQLTSEQMTPAKPLSPLDRVSFPDFSDFPWHRYPNRIIPLMTGRGCEWGKCTFCADVVISSGRTFRSRSIENVMEEIAYQSALYDSHLFAFLDLKLNSDLEVWRGLIEHIPRVNRDAQWTASLHVDNRRDNGLSKTDLQRAKAAGLVRITCGLESGSPRILKRMAKGMNLDRMSQFLKDAHEVGISVRLTSIIGYPGEEPEDIDLTTQFINDHSLYIERIVLNRFTLLPGTSIERKIVQSPKVYSEIKIMNLDKHNMILSHENNSLAKRAYYLAAFKLMRAIHKVNRKVLLPSAKEFEGVM